MTLKMKRCVRPKNRPEENEGRLSCFLLPSFTFLFMLCMIRIPVNVNSFNGKNLHIKYFKPTIVTTTTQLHESQLTSNVNASCEDDTFPSMMAELSEMNGTNAPTQNVISTGADFVSTKYEFNDYLQTLELEQSAKERRKEEEEEQKRSLQETATEINLWTKIMKGGMFFQKKKKAETVDMLYKELRDMSRYDCEQVDVYWDRLLPAVSYLGTERVVKVYDALRVAYRGHRGQVRKSGEPFIIHPVEVSLLLAGLKMDEVTVMAGLLHDTVEDTDLTFELIEEMFGGAVRAIVEGETKVSKLPKIALSEYADEQAENLRQMFVAMTDDYRIIIVKLADRLHNMRTLRHMKKEKQIKISRETLDIFAPLAHRMGIWQFKSELEDTAFMYLYPQEYERLNGNLRQHQQKFEDTLEKAQEIIKEGLNSDPTLQEQAAKVTVSGRMKEIYSLWHKMETKGEHNINRINDVVALRVIITPKGKDEEIDYDKGVWLCYHALGLTNHLNGFKPASTRVKDYISFPKPNGYQSLHTAVILNGQKIEVQIRTSLMHQVAEYGMAAHWLYADGKRRQSGSNDLYNTPWLSSIKEWQNDSLNARDFVDSVRNELLGKRVFCFLRNGKILNLARGATAIDAAYAIHSEVMLNMHGVEINGKAVNVSYELQNGDVVSILTGEGRPSTDWIEYAKSRSTRSRLRSYFRVKQKESLVEAGNIILMDYLWIHGPLIEKSSLIEEDFSLPNTVVELTSLIREKSQYDDIDDLLMKIGEKSDRGLIHSFVSDLFKVPQKLLVNAERNAISVIPTRSVLNAVHDRRKKAEDAAAAAVSAQGNIPVEDRKNVSTTEPDCSKLSNVELYGNKAEFADSENFCEKCLPVWGDDIVGTRPKNTSSYPITTVHRTCCPVAQRAINRAKAKDPLNNFSDLSNCRQQIFIEDPVELRWPTYEPDQKYILEIVVHANDRKLLLANCSEIVSKLSQIVKTGSQTTNEQANLVFLIKIRCLDDLQTLMDELQQVSSVMAVERRFGSELHSD